MRMIGINHRVGTDTKKSPAGGTAAAAHLVRVNLGIRESDPRLARALESEQTARELADSLLETT